MKKYYQTLNKEKKREIKEVYDKLNCHFDLWEGELDSFKDVPKGSWSDDTSMTLATLHSIIEKGKIDTNDMADKFLKWFRNSEYTPNNKTFDIGRTTLQSLAKYELKLDKASNCGGSSEHDNNYRRTTWNILWSQ